MGFQSPVSGAIYGTVTEIGSISAKGAMARSHHATAEFCDRPVWARGEGEAQPEGTFSSNKSAMSEPIRNVASLHGIRY